MLSFFVLIVVFSFEYLKTNGVWITSFLYIFLAFDQTHYRPATRSCLLQRRCRRCCSGDTPGCGVSAWWDCGRHQALHSTVISLGLDQRSKLYPDGEGGSTFYMKIIFEKETEEFKSKWTLSLGLFGTTTSNEKSSRHQKVILTA